MKWFQWNRKDSLRPLTPEQMAVLSRFLVFEASIEDIRSSLAGVFDINLEPWPRTAATRFRVPEPGIVITCNHIAKAQERKRLGLITKRELTDCATMLLLNDAYEPDPHDQDLIAGWLHDTSFDVGPT